MLPAAAAVMASEGEPSSVTVALPAATSWLAEVGLPLPGRNWTRKHMAL